MVKYSNSLFSLLSTMLLYGSVNNMLTQGYFVVQPDNSSLYFTTHMKIYYRLNVLTCMRTVKAQSHHWLEAVLMLEDKVLSEIGICA